MKTMDIAGWERMYHSGERGSEDAPTTLLLEAVAELTPGKAIDLACGTGRNALYLAKHGWDVTAIDGSETAIQILRERASDFDVNIKTQVHDLQAPDFALPENTFDLVVIAYYLQRDLFAEVKEAVRPGGVVLAIAHTPDPGEDPSHKRIAPGELQTFFRDWEVLHSYEGPSRDPAHHRPVAEIVARRK